MPADTLPARCWSINSDYQFKWHYNNINNYQVSKSIASAITTCYHKPSAVRPSRIRARGNLTCGSQKLYKGNQIYRRPDARSLQPCQAASFPAIYKKWLSQKKVSYYNFI